MINKQFYTSKWLIPIFVISVLIFTLLTVGVMHRTSFIQHIDAASLQLMTDYLARQSAVLKVHGSTLL